MDMLSIVRNALIVKRNIEKQYTIEIEQLNKLNNKKYVADISLNIVSNQAKVVSNFVFIYSEELIKSWNGLFLTSIFSTK